jgi:arylsulfatase A-like enzyme
LRKGKWKILHVGPAAGGRQDGKWQLYDMSVDPGEIHDLSEQNPKVMEELLKDWEEYVSQTGTAWGDDVPPMQTEDFQAKKDLTFMKTFIGGE